MILDENLFNFTGRIGDYVVYWYRGKKCIRKRPKAPKGPPTPGMVTQQKRMQSASIFYHALKKAGIYPYWQKAAEGKVENGYNLITKVNMSAFDGEGQICDFTKLHPTPRLLASPNGMTLSPTGDSMWKLIWKNSPNTGCTGNEDLLQVLLMRDNRSFALKPADTGGARRKDGEALIKVPEELENYVHLFAFFCSEADGKCSESRYFYLLTSNF